MPDDGPEPACPLPCYHLGLTREDGDSTFFLGDDGSRAFGSLDTAFDALVESFAGATGRPLAPGDLPPR